jgi:hypothetical protein
LDFVAAALPPQALLTVTPGSLARGDLEQTPYSLYTRYAVENAPPGNSRLASFEQQYLLRSATARVVEEAMGKTRIDIDLQWEQGAGRQADRPLPVVFVHLRDPAGLLAQSDEPLGRGLWAADWWRPGLVVGEQRTLILSRPFAPRQQRLVVGLYWPDTGQRLAASAAHGQAVDEVEIEVTLP